MARKAAGEGESEATPRRSTRIQAQPQKPEPVKKTAKPRAKKAKGEDGTTEGGEAPKPRGRKRKEPAAPTATEGGETEEKANAVETEEPPAKKAKPASKPASKASVKPSSKASAKPASKKPASRAGSKKPTTKVEGDAKENAPVSTAEKSIAEDPDAEAAAEAEDTANGTVNA